MSMTMTQQILARHCGLESVKAGDLIEVSLDLILGNDLTTPVAIREFAKIEGATAGASMDTLFDIADALELPAYKLLEFRD